MFKTQCVLALIALYVGLAHSWDIAISMGDQLQFYTNTIKTDTVRFNSQNLWALAYDEVHNMLLYVDKRSNNDAIGGFNLSTMEYKYIIQRNGRNIRGLAFDPATELLFFSDLNEKSINWFSLKPGAKNNFYGNLLIKMDDGVPTDLAVDSCRGYIYWINTNLTTPRIERARFDGSEREVVINLNSLSINTTYTREPHSLAIDQQTQNMFWVEPTVLLKYNLCKADLNGKNKQVTGQFDYISFKEFTNPSNVLTVSYTSLIFWDWSKPPSVWKGTKKGISLERLFRTESEIPIGIAANYQISDQDRGFTNCAALTRLMQNMSVNKDSLNIAKEYEGPFCVNGTKVNGQSRCQCTPGFITDEGFPTCSCNAGYSGERCDFNSCHDYCRNNGDCHLDEKSEPVCRCKGNYVGDRCEVSPCLNYCMQGNCSFNEEGLPTCSCNTGYSGKRCEVDACHSYCMINGVCSLNEEEEPVCQCGDNHEGSRCEAAKAVGVTARNITQDSNASTYYNNYYYYYYNNNKKPDSH